MQPETLSPERLAATLALVRQRVVTAVAAHTHALEQAGQKQVLWGMAKRAGDGKEGKEREDG